MKKIIMTATLVACAAVVTAQTVTSANIVGYSKKDVAAGDSVVVAPQFGGVAELVVLGDAFSGLILNDQVFIWNGAGYDKYVYYGEPTGWLSQTFVPSNDLVIDAGTSMFLETTGGSAASVIMSGEVPSADSIAVPMITGFNLVGNAYPVAITLAEISAGGGIVANDAVYVWNGAGYDKYTYYGEPTGWLTQTFLPANGIVMPVGDGFWVDSLAGGTLTFTKNY